jgi:hypothetical protein
MTITADKLRARLAECEAQRDQMLANANAFNGAAQECRYWLGELEKVGEVKPFDPTGWGFPDDGKTISEP